MTPDRERDLLDANNRYLEEARIARRAAAGGFQARVDPWLLACFGETIARDRQERAHRFLEEAIELVQAAGTTASEAHQLVDYVFARPVGELPQESGGVSVTHAAFCLAHGIDMAEAAERELARVWTKVEAIRAKQAAKPKHSPLPEHVRTEAWQPTHRHLKRGSLYQQIGIASLQTETPCEETAALVVYRGEDGKLWARPHDEFTDGRFEELPLEAPRP